MKMKQHMIYAGVADGVRAAKEGDRIKSEGAEDRSDVGNTVIAMLASTKRDQVRVYDSEVRFIPLSNSQQVRRLSERAK
jgi:hypothetical protein